MKRISRLLIFICLILLLSTSATFGTVSSTPNIKPFAENYVKASASISLSDSTVKVSGIIIGKVGQTTKTSIHLYLQQYKSGRWVSIDDWTSTANVYSVSLIKTKVVAKGYKYRTKAVCTAYIGSTEETVTKYSESVNY